MVSSVLRRVFHKPYAGIIISRRIPRSAISCCRFSKLGGDDRMISTYTASDDTTPSRMSPWLMLPPSGCGGTGAIAYKFYSLAERKVLSMSKSESESECGGGIVKKIYNLAKRKFLSMNKRESVSKAESGVECVGSSHGWIALFDRRNNDVFLRNPLSGRHIKLPSMERVHDRHTAKVLKLVLSSSPEDNKCCAMMIYGPLNRLAFCFPGDASSEWTPIGDRLGDGTNKPVHADLAYCKTQKWFSTIDAFGQLEFDPFCRRPQRLLCSGRLYQWDPPVDGWGGESLEYYEQGYNTLHWVKKNETLLKEQCLQIPHIVHVDGSDHPYIAFQFVMPMNPDCHGFERREDCYLYPSKSVGFVVLKLDTYDYEGENDNDIVDDLDGLAMFVGINHSFALPASDFPELKPDSIYFTDSKRIKSIDGSNDIGVFDYRNKTVHGIGICHSDHDHMDMDMDMGMDMDRHRPSSPGVFKPSPVWFTPAAHS